MPGRRTILRARRPVRSRRRRRRPCAGGLRPKLQPKQRPGESGQCATHRRRVSERTRRRELVVVLTVRQDETAHPPERRMTTIQRQQEQPAGRVVGDRRGIFHVEQFEAVEQQPSQRGGRSVCSRGQRPPMRSQREVDRDAAVAVLERDDDITPQVTVRERAGEEDERRPMTRRSPGQGSEPGFQPFGFHEYKTYSQYVIPASPVCPPARFIASCP